MRDAPRPNLEYDRTTTVVTVRGFRTLLVLTLLNTIVLGWFVVGPQVTPFVQRQWEQWQVKREMRRQEAQLLAIQKQCLTHTIPAGTVAYTEDPDLSQALAVQRKQYETISASNVRWENWVSPVALKEPPVWTALRGLKAIPVGYELTMAYPMIFLHERTTPSGQPRLVVVQWVAEQRYAFSPMIGESDTVTTSRLLAVRMHAPASRGVAAKLIDHVQVRVMLPAPDFVRLTRVPGKDPVEAQRPAPLTLFAGRPDPADGSHFTIAYTIGTTPGVIDGWITGDELILKPRAGETTVIKGQPTWHLTDAAAPAGAATRPATRP